MSKKLKPFLMFFSASLHILSLSYNSNAQDIKATVRVKADAPVTAQVSGRFLPEAPAQNARNLSFLRDYAGIEGLGERISNVRLTDKFSKTVASRRMLAGEYLAEGDFLNWSYSADLTPLPETAAAAHISWLKSGGGILMFDDLLPQVGKLSAEITFEMPPGWKIGSVEREIAKNTYVVADVGKAVFYIGSGQRQQDIQAGRSRLKLNLSGEWLFSNDEAAEMAASIFKEYERLFGSSPAAEFYIGISKFPSNVAAGNWEADTRGRSITIVSSDMPFKSQSLQRLHEQLRHELFHLWIPNGVNLSGNYDWFYEGFALYQSLKTGVTVGRIRFDDFLDTLSRTYDIDKSQPPGLSLTDASKNRWNGANNRIYARGMLVAFMCDLALLKKSNGRQSVPNLLREIYEKHRPPNSVSDGNAAVLAVLRSHSELVSIIDRNINDAQSTDWTALLNAVGLEADSGGRLTKLTITAQPSGRQKDLLSKLGYNKGVRKPEKSK